MRGNKSRWLLEEMTLPLRTKDFIFKITYCSTLIIMIFDKFITERRTSGFIYFNFVDATSLCERLLLFYCSIGRNSIRQYFDFFERVSRSAPSSYSSENPAQSVGPRISNHRYSPGRPGISESGQSSILSEAFRLCRCLSFVGQRARAYIHATPSRVSFCTPGRSILAESQLVYFSRAARYADSIRRIRSTLPGALD